MFHHLGGIYHSLRYVSINLYAYRGLEIKGVHLGYGLGGIAYEPVRRHELRIHHICPVLLAHPTEGCVCHILHRSKQQRPVAQFYIPYLHIP